MRRTPVSRLLVPLRGVLLCAAAAVVLFAARPASQGTAAAYAVYSSDGRRSLPFRTSASTDYVELAQVAALFNLTVTEDAAAGGLTIRGAAQPIQLIPGQSFASVGPGRVVSLPAPVQRERNAYQVPVDFIRQALGPALGQRVEIRRASHVVIVGDVRLPRVTGTMERTAGGARLTVDIEPSTPHRVTRDGARLAVTFDAVAVDLGVMAGLMPEFTGAPRLEGSTLVFTLGAAAASHRLDDAASRLVVDLLTPEAAASAAATPSASARPETPAGPSLDLTGAGTLRTIVIDAGHGGEDAGVKHEAGLEKDIALQAARRLKSVLESRFGLRVLMTRDADEDVAADRRAALANNNKADLFVSLHANASVQPEAKGVQVLSLHVTDYQPRAGGPAIPQVPVPVLGGGTRVIDVVPWDLAQLPFADRSAAVASVLVDRLGDHGVPFFVRRAGELPLRPLVGVHMPAVLVELGFLTNEDDRAALTSGDRVQKVTDALAAAIAQLRGGIPTQVPAPEAR